MIDSVNSFKVHGRGKREDAVELLKKFAALTKKVTPGLSTRVLTPTNGEFNRVSFVITYESHEQMEQHAKKVRATPEWDAYLKEIDETDLWGEREIHHYRVEDLQ